MSKPSRVELALALDDAGAAHHDYEEVALAGERDEGWAGFYAAYALGRLGGFAAPSTLSRWLAEAPSGEHWPTSAADYVLERLTA